MIAEQMENIGRVLWEFVIGFIKAMGDVWDFLATPIVIEEVRISLGLFSIKIFDGIVFTPLALSGAVIIAILFIGLISLFIP